MKVYYQTVNGQCLGTQTRVMTRLFHPIHPELQTEMTLEEHENALYRD